MSTALYPYGLANVGNNCYLNSVIQALRHCRPFTEYFTGKDWERHRHSERKADGLVSELSALLQAFTTTQTPLSPSRFLQQFIRVASEMNDEFRLGAQADAAEALQILLDTLHTQQSREVRMEITGKAATPEHAEYIRSLNSWADFFRKEYSPLVEQFYGQTRTTITCDGCKAVSTRFEPWSVLKLPIPGGEKAGSPAPVLQACFRAAFASETLDDYACDACKGRGPATMAHSISRYPPYMIIALKRFTNAGSKVRARIPYDPEHIDTAEFIAWRSIQKPQDAQYQVCATIEHLGNSRGGHYCMRGRDSTGVWRTYDDSRVSMAGPGVDPDTYVMILECRKD